MTCLSKAGGGKFIFPPGRTKPLFVEDLGKIEAEISDIVKNGRFLVIGGAGTIGSAICRELFARDPKETGKFLDSRM